MLPSWDFFPILQVLVKGDNFLDMLGKMSNKDEGSSLIWSQNVYEAAPDSILDLKGCLDESQIIKRKVKLPPLSEVE